MQTYAAVFRTGDTLNTGFDKVKDLSDSFQDIKINDKSLLWNTELVETLELENLLSQGLITVASALNRTESRGAHARDDFPERDDAEWLKHSLVKLDGNDISVSYRKVNLETMTDEVESVPPKRRVY